MPRRSYVKQGGVIVAFMLITAALSLLVSSSPGVSAQRNITPTLPPFDPLPGDPLPQTLPTTAPQPTSTPTLVQPTTTPVPFTPIPHPQSQDLIFDATVIDGQVSVTLYNPIGIEWVQVWVGTPNLETTLHLEWYALATAATCNGLNCTVLTNLTVNPGEYTVYIQPWGENIGFIENELDGWLGSVTFDLDTTQLVTPNSTPGVTVGSITTGLVPIFHERFEYPNDFADWIVPNTWMFEESRLTYGLHIHNSADELQYTLPHPQDLIVEVEFALADSAFRLTTHRNGNDNYHVAIHPSGIVELERSGVVVETANVSTVGMGAWRTLQLATMNGEISIYLDSRQIITHNDSAYLPHGEIAMRFDMAVDPQLYRLGGVDNFQLYNYAAVNSLSNDIEGDQQALHTTVFPSQVVTNECIPGALPDASFHMVTHIANDLQDLVVTQYSVDTVGKLIPITDPAANLSVLSTMGTEDSYFYSHSIHEPAISPDGMRIAFKTQYSYDSNNKYHAYGISVLDLTTCQINVIVPPDEYIKYSPDWSGDGTQIVYERIQNSVRDIYIVDSQGIGTSTLLVANGEAPAWSPVDDKIAFMRATDSETDLYVYDVSDGTATLYGDFGFGRRPAWSADGTQIVFVLGRWAYLTNAVPGSTSYQLLFQSTDALNTAMNPVWSPDPDNVYNDYLIHENYIDVGGAFQELYQYDVLAGSSSLISIPISQDLTEPDWWAPRTTCSAITRTSANNSSPDCPTPTPTMTPTSTSTPTPTVTPTPKPVEDITVTTTDPAIVDDTDCSIIEAIEAANSGSSFNGCIVAPANTYNIILDNAQIYSLTQAYQSGDNGLPIITTANSITFQGNGSTIERSTAATDDFRIMQIDAVATVTLDNLTIQGGRASSDGGGVYNDGSLTIQNNSIVQYNVTDADGGGVYNTGAFIVNFSTVRNNRSGATGLEVENFAITSSIGGGVYNSGILNVSASNIYQNRTDNFGGGIYNSGSLTVTESRLERNVAVNSLVDGRHLAYLSTPPAPQPASRLDSGGGAIFHEGSGSVSVTNSCISLNTARNGGGVFMAPGATTVNASSNWWGEVDGPTVAAIGITDGFDGDVVTPDVVITNFVSTAEALGLSLPILEGVVNQGCFELSVPNPFNTNDLDGAWGRPDYALEMFIRVSDMLGREVTLSEAAALSIYTASVQGRIFTEQQTHLFTEVVGRIYYEFNKFDRGSGALPCPIGFFQAQSRYLENSAIGLLCTFGTISEWYGEFDSVEYWSLYVADFIRLDIKNGHSAINSNITWIERGQWIAETPGNRQLGRPNFPICEKWELGLNREGSNNYDDDPNVVRNVQGCPWVWGNLNVLSEDEWAEARLNNTPLTEIDGIPVNPPLISPENNTLAQADFGPSYKTGLPDSAYVNNPDSNLNIRAIIYRNDEALGFPFFLFTIIQNNILRCGEPLEARVDFDTASGRTPYCTP